MISGDLRLTATAASRRLRRGRVMTFFTYRIISLALLTTAITAFLTLYIPNPLTISSIAHDSISTSSNYTIKGVVTRREASISANSSVNASLPPPLPPPPPLVRRKSFNDNNANSGSREVKKTASLRRREPAYWRMSPDDALKYAIKEIDNAPEIVEDPDLYVPLFKNVSVFKRSYELMEKILKVYIYRDGKRPIFHTPELRGIYASEGWFMKLMEESRRFVTPDPQKAHLFYLPYSSRQLENALYVPDSHDLKPLSIYLRDYVNWIAGKYSFWNRTRGSDHFLVACHDWGPYTTTAHEELCKNTIKALCNADTSEGIFIKGKDVSLPETTIRNPRRPLRFVGSGRPVSQRSILAFFAGNVHGRVRPVLLEHWAGKDPDMHIYGPLPDRVSRKMTYIQHMKTSKYCICPMGFEVNSPRIVEAIYYECVPVIIADNFVLPFEEVLDWSVFSVVVPEKDIPNLKNILLGISLRRYLKMHTCVKMLQKHFLWHPRPVKYDLYHMLLHSIWFNRINQVRIEKEH
ncbi:putative glycosyltransferase [Carex littledalei]|uniref:Putative glycosyltransferase n=1 Tax=Carex littledalei TaxID=544730 RepID=A0A833VH38_9POAL|nr:putative glycosyltransferase [Carex littledalei]